MSIESALSCLAALPLVGGSYSRKEGHLVTKCPSCGSDMDILQPSFVCRARTCDFGRGGAVDYLAFTAGGYGAALRLIGEFIPGLKDSGLVEANHLFRRRQFLEFFLHLESNSSNSDHERARLRNQFSGTGVSPYALKGSVLYATGAEASTLQLLCLEYGLIPPNNLSNKPVMLLPYWGSYHALGHLMVISENFDEIRMLKVEPFHCSWFGLNQKRGTCQALDTFPEYLDTLAASEHFPTNHPERFPSHLLINAGCDELGYQPKDLVFHGFGDTWFSNLPVWSLYANFGKSRFYETGRGYMDLNELLEHLLRASMNDRLVEFLDLCGSLRLPVASRTFLMLKADQLLDRSAVSYLRTIMSRRLLEKNIKGSLFETAEGYEVEAKGIIERLSNFTLTLHSVVSFSSLAEMNYQGTAIVGPVTFDFDIPSKDLDSPGRLERVLQSLQDNRPGGGAAGEASATVLDRNLFKRVLDYLRKETATLPRSRGYRNLGWTRRHDLFITPLATVDSAGITYGVRYYPDELGDHHCFSSDLEPLSPVVEEPSLPVNLAELVSGLVAQTLRYYYGLKVPPIPIRNNEGRELGQRLFRGFGQNALLRLTSIVPSNLGLNRGLPCLIAGLNELQAAKVSLAGIYLSDTGLDLNAFSKQEIDTAAEVLNHLILSVVHKLITGDPVDYRERRSVRPLAAMAVEGANMIRADFWPAWPEAGRRYAAVDLMLESYQDRLHEVATVDEKTDDIVLSPASWESIKLDPVDLNLEWGLLGERVVMRPEGLRVDRSSFYQAIGKFYGDVPKLVALR